MTTPVVRVLNLWTLIDDPIQQSLHMVAADNEALPHRVGPWSWHCSCEAVGQERMRFLWEVGIGGVLQKVVERVLYR